MLVAGSYPCLFLAYNLHSLFAGNPGMELRPLVMLAGAGEEKNILLFFGIAMLLLVTLTGYAMVFSSTVKYKAGVREIIPGIKTPLPCGENLFGSARWLSARMYKRAFCPIKINPRDEAVKWLVGSGRMDLEEAYIPEEDAVFEAEPFASGGVVVGQEKNGKTLYIVDEDTHSLTIGATRSSKTRSVVLPSICVTALAGESMVISDVKGELFFYTAPFLRRLGYEVIDLDFENPAKSTRYNFMQPVIDKLEQGDVTGAKTATNELVEGITGKKNSPYGERIWTEGEKSILACCIMAVAYDNRNNPRLQNLTNVYHFIALDPVSEVTADKHSFGFRKGRCCQDACEYIFADLARAVSPEWVLEGDIKGCFDNISHDWLMANIPMDKSVLKQFLKAGFVFKDELFSTNDGTPQGGVISPILANMALDGMEKVLSDRFHTNRLGKVDLRFKNAHKVNLVRYADDFIITAATKEIAMEAKEIIRNFLKIRGLELSKEKTIISHIDDGFDMLGWTFRKFKGKLIVKPSKKAIKAFVATLSETIFGRGKAWKQKVLIGKLNQKIRGWANYHQSVCASEAFPSTPIYTGYMYLRGKRWS